MLSMIFVCQGTSDYIVSERRNWGQSNKLTFLHLILLIWTLIWLHTLRNQMRGSYFEWHFSFLDPNPLKKASLLHVYYMAYIKEVFRSCFFLNIYAFSSFFLFLFLSILFVLSIQKEKGKRTQLKREENSVEISLGYILFSELV